MSISTASLPTDTQEIRDRALVILRKTATARQRPILEHRLAHGTVATIAATLHLPEKTVSRILRELHRKAEAALLIARIPL